MRLDFTTTVASLRHGPGSNELTVLCQVYAPLPKPQDELEVDGRVYRLVTQLWPARGVMGAILLFRTALTHRADTPYP